MKKLTKEQYDNVIKAIDLAQDAGKCNYVLNNGSPCCVIGQLIHLEGDEIKLVAITRERINHVLETVKLPNISKYDVSFLYHLQLMWDEVSFCAGFSEDDIKHKMKTYVDSCRKL